MRSRRGNNRVAPGVLAALWGLLAISTALFVAAVLSCDCDMISGRKAPDFCVAIVGLLPTVGAVLMAGPSVLASLHADTPEGNRLAELHMVPSIAMALVYSTPILGGGGILLLVMLLGIMGHIFLWVTKGRLVAVPANRKKRNRRRLRRNAGPLEAIPATSDSRLPDPGLEEEITVPTANALGAEEDAKHFVEMSVEELAVLEADKACLRDKLALAILHLKESRRKGVVREARAESQQARIDHQSSLLVNKDTLVGRLRKEVKTTRTRLGDAKARCHDQQRAIDRQTSLAVDQGNLARRRKAELERTRTSLRKERIAKQDSHALVKRLKAEVARLQRNTPVCSERSTQTQLSGSGNAAETVISTKHVPATAFSKCERPRVWAESVFFAPGSLSVMDGSNVCPAPGMGFVTPNDGGSASTITVSPSSSTDSAVASPRIDPHSASSVSSAPPPSVSAASTLSVSAPSSNPSVPTPSSTPAMSEASSNSQVDKKKLAEAAACSAFSGTGCVMGSDIFLADMVEDGVVGGDARSCGDDATVDSGDWIDGEDAINAFLDDDDAAGRDGHHEASDGDACPRFEEQQVMSSVSPKAESCKAATSPFCTASPGGSGIGDSFRLSPVITARSPSFVDAASVSAVVEATVLSVIEAPVLNVAEISVPVAANASIPATDEASTRSVDAASVSAVAKATVREVIEASPLSVAEASARSISEGSVPSVAKASVPTVAEASVSAVAEHTVRTVIEAAVLSVAEASISVAAKASAPAVTGASIPAAAKASTRSMDAASVSAVAEDTVRTVIEAVVLSAAEASIPVAAKASAPAVTGASTPAADEASDRLVDAASVSPVAEDTIGAVIEASILSVSEASARSMSEASVPCVTKASVPTAAEASVSAVAEAMVRSVIEATVLSVAEASVHSTPSVDAASVSAVAESTVHAVIEASVISVAAMGVAASPGPQESGVVDESAGAAAAGSGANVEPTVPIAQGPAAGPVLQRRLLYILRGRNKDISSLNPPVDA